MNLALEAFVEGRAEMGFWPFATIAYVYTNTGNPFHLVGIALFAFSGAITYYLIDNVREAIEEAQSRMKTRNRVSRSGRRNSASGGVTDLIEEVFTFFPENQKAWWIVGLSIALNVFGGIGLYLYLANHVLAGDISDLAGVGLFGLPLLYIGILLTVLIWRTDE